MRQSVRHQLLIGLVATIVFFTNLGATRLWDQDEAFFARTAVEMHERNEWVVPYFNGELFAHKPPLMFWLMRASFLLFGTTEFAARFPSAIFAAATCLLVYRLGARMFSPQVGLWGGLAMSTAVMFDLVARAATPDGFLVFFSTLALYLFVRSQHWEDQANDLSNCEAPQALPWRVCAAMYAAMAVAVLVKGPIGVLLPGCIVGLFLLVHQPVAPTPKDAAWSERMSLFLLRFTPARIVRTVWAMRPLTAIAAVLLVAGPWFALVGWRTDGDFLREFFGTHNLGRFNSAMDNHNGAIWFYVPAILVGIFPWSIFGIPTTLDLVRRCRGSDSWQRGAKLLTCWIIVYVGFFSLAGTKLPNYVLPAYPAIALAAACFVDRWLTRPASVNRWWPWLSFGSLLLVGLLAALAVPVLAGSGDRSRWLIEQLGTAPEMTDDLRLIGWPAGMLIFSGVVALVFIYLQRRRAALIGLAMTAAAFSLVFYAVLAVRIDRHQPSPAVADAIRRNASGIPQVAQFGYFRPSLVYYTGGRVESCKSPQRVADFLEQSPDAFVVTTEDSYARLTAMSPAAVVVLDRQAEFPGRGKVLVLGRKSAIAQRPAGPKNE